MGDTPTSPGSATSTPPAAGLKGYAHAALRIGAGPLFFMQGTPKLFGWGAGPLSLDAWRSRR